MLNSLILRISKLTLALVVGLLIADIAVAQEKKPKVEDQPVLNEPVKKKTRGKKNNGSPVSKERRQMLEDFVRNHHPELESILKKLRDGQRRKYNEAMKGLDQSVAKLEKVEERSPNRYEAALENWKLESRIKVAAARLKLNESKAAREKLESLISSLFDSTLRRLKEDRTNMAERLKKMDQRIAEMESDRSIIIQRRIKSATRGAKKKKESKK